MLLNLIYIFFRINFLRPALEMYVRVCTGVFNAVTAIVDGVYWVGSASVVDMLPLLVILTALSWTVIMMYIRRDHAKTKGNLLPTITKECDIIYYFGDSVDMTDVDDHAHVD